MFWKVRAGVRAILGAARGKGSEWCPLGQELGRRERKVTARGDAGAAGGGRLRTARTRCSSARLTGESACPGHRRGPAARSGWAVQRPGGAARGAPAALPLPLPHPLHTQAHSRAPNLPGETNALFLLLPPPQPLTCRQNRGHCHPVSAVGLSLLGPTCLLASGMFFRISFPSCPHYASSHVKYHVRARGSGLHLNQFLGLEHHPHEDMARPARPQTLSSHLHPTR